MHWDVGRVRLRPELLNTMYSLRVCDKDVFLYSPSSDTVTVRPFVRVSADAGVDGGKDASDVGAVSPSGDGGEAAKGNASTVPQCGDQESLVWEVAEGYTVSEVQMAFHFADLLVVFFAHGFGLFDFKTGHAHPFPLPVCKKACRLWGSVWVSVWQVGGYVYGCGCGCVGVGVAGSWVGVCVDGCLRGRVWGLERQQGALGLCYSVWSPVVAGPAKCIWPS